MWFQFNSTLARMSYNAVGDIKSTHLGWIDQMSNVPLLPHGEQFFLVGSRASSSNVFASFGAGNHVAGLRRFEFPIIGPGFCSASTAQGVGQYSERQRSEGCFHICWINGRTNLKRLTNVQDTSADCFYFVPFSIAYTIPIIKMSYKILSLRSREYIAANLSKTRWLLRLDMFGVCSPLGVDCNTSNVKPKASNVQHDSVGCGVISSRPLSAGEIKNTTIENFFPRIWWRKSSFEPYVSMASFLSP